MKKYSIIFITLLLSIVGTTCANAQEDRTQSIIQSYLHGWEYSLKAGFPATTSQRNTQNRQLCSRHGYLYRR